MGFKPGAYCTVWSVEPKPSGKSSRVRIACSKKNQEGVYEQTFGDYCLFVGEANTKAASLHERDRIKIVECDVQNKYDKEQKRTYYDFIVYKFENVDSSFGGGSFGGSDNSYSEPKESAYDEDHVPF